MTASAIEHMAGIGMSQEQIAAVFSISIDTYRRRIEESPELAASFHRGQNVGLMELQNKAFEMAKDGNTQMLKYVLSTKGNWNEKTEVIFNQKKSVDSLSRGEVEQKLEEDLSKVLSMVEKVLKTKKIDSD
jgi:hypothetical protein